MTLNSAFKKMKISKRSASQINELSAAMIARDATLRSVSKAMKAIDAAPSARLAKAAATDFVRIAMTMADKSRAAALASSVPEDIIAAREAESAVKDVLYIIEESDQDNRRLKAIVRETVLTCMNKLTQ